MTAPEVELRDIVRPAASLLPEVVAMEQRSVHEASRLAFRPHTEWFRVAASFGDGLTDSSDELLHLAAQAGQL